MEVFLEPQALFTLIVVGVMMILLVREAAGSDTLLLGALMVLMLGGVVTPREALAGFSNTGVAVIAGLFIISAAIQHSGALYAVSQGFFRTVPRQHLSPVLFRMMLPVTVLSAFVANTPILMIFVPIIKKWSENIRISGSKLFIPLSYAAILGGLCTLIGTSTNLVVHGLMIANGYRGLKMFELAWIGVPCAIVGIAYVVFWGHRFLPDRKDVSALVSENKKEYVVEMRVIASSPLIGKTVREAGLRNLRGLFLIDIERRGECLGPISSKEILEAEDRLMFAGLTGAVVDLQEIPGLVPAAEGLFEKDFATLKTHLVEAVISATSPILGQTVKDANFRERYGAGVVAVHRNGERIVSKIGSIGLRVGDTLLLFASDNFLVRWKDSQDFYLVSSLKTMLPKTHKRAPLVLALTALMVLFILLGPEGANLVKGISILHCVFAAAFLMVLTRCIEIPTAKKSIRWDILVTIAASFGISQALTNSGASDMIAGWVVAQASGWGPHGVLLAIYLLTMLVTEVITNNAAAAMAFPIAMSTAKQLGVDPMPFFITIALAASAGFATPIGYQTNLIVQAAGSYRFKDYLKIGIPLDLICCAIAVTLIPLVWKF